MTSPPDAGGIEAARMLLVRLGVTPEQLVASGGVSARASMPTFDAYIPRVCLAVSPGTRRAYDSYWRRIQREWGSRRLDEPTALEIKQLSELARSTAVERRSTRNGRSAAEHVIAALRCIYRHAVADGLIADAANPAIRVAKPRRLASLRRALRDDELAAINSVAGSTGNDPGLDTLLLRLHVETACRRGGALGLRALDLDPQQCLIRLREKGDTQRWQPVSPTLMDALRQHVDERGGAQSAQHVFRYRTGKPITARRYDYLWNRLGQHLPWVATQQISTHWLRHTTLTWVERHFGYAVARAFAGHSGKADVGTTSTYVRADIFEVAEALAALSQEAHPMARHRVSRD